MLKRKLETNEIPDIIRKCYESDADRGLKFHETSDLGVEHCISDSISFYLTYNIDIYVITNDDKFIGYFGEENYNNERYLTGFFVSPEMRKLFKKDFWDIICKHFNNNVKTGIYSKNLPAKKFLINNGCKFVESSQNINGPIEMFVFNQESV